ncbi:MAG: arginine--tRNA ligase [Candidatus Rokubacteria bacterium]|nr:arginine--tRNA ligase [Candidatus Rokubacteria bacterium]
MTMETTDRLTDGVRTALRAAGLPDVADCIWEVPRQAEHGDYASNVAMTLAKPARRAPRQIADLIVAHFPPLPEVARLEIAGPGFINVFLSPAWTASAVRGILAAGDAYGQGERERGTRLRLEFVSANPTGPLVIVNARAAAIGDSVARLLRAQGARVTAEYYVNDAGNQFEALARSFEARLREAVGLPFTFPENGYPGEYVAELARDYLTGHRLSTPAEVDTHLTSLGADPQAALVRLGRWAVRRIVDGQRRVLAEYGVEFDAWTSEQADVREAGLPERAIDELTKRGVIHEQDGALWFRSTDFGDDKDRVLRKSDGELTYFAVDVAFYHFTKFGAADRVVTLLGPDHHGYVGRIRAAMRALGHPPEALDVLIVQLVTLLRDGTPVRMSKRRGEFVLMEELLEEVGRDAARFTFLTRRHDSPLEFDLAVATRQSTDNPVYYVQYAHARIRSIWKQIAEQGIAVPPWSEVDLTRLSLPEEQQIIKRLLGYPEVVAAAAHALEAHRIAYWLQELAGLFHPYYRAHRVIQDDRALMSARLALCTAVGQVIKNALGLLGVSAPDSMTRSEADA